VTAAAAFDPARHARRKNSVARKTADGLADLSDKADADADAPRAFPA
jgi:hypothetical protein